MTRRPFLAALAGLFVFQAQILPASACKKADWGITDRYPETIRKVVAMPSDAGLQQLARQHGLGVVNVMWEDTGRYQGSSVGPNISDLTLQVRENTAGGIRTHLLPVIRHPNFSDKTADIDADKIWIRVGNQTEGGELVARPLKEVLSNLKEYMSDSTRLLGSDNFIAKRDSHFLVSAQHVFLPIPKSGKAEFNPVLYNYQSYPGAPAVMTLLVTRQGTSVQVIENNSGDQSYQGWGQQLFFNNAGQRTALTAERRSDVKARIDQQGTARPQDVGALEEGADMMMIIQVPLKQKRRPQRGGWFQGEGAMLDGLAGGAAPPQSMAPRRSGRSDVEKAVLGHGEDLGKFVETNGLKLERDDRFPIRVTVQFYRATSNGVVDAQDMKEVASTIAKVYDSADFVGSLVVPKSEQNRPTDWRRPAADQVSWWNRVFGS